MNSKFVLHSFLICLLTISIVNVNCLVRVDWDNPNQKPVKKAPSPDAFPTAEDANLTQVERARLIREGKRIGLSPEGLELVHGQSSGYSYENACTQLLAKCQTNCMEEWYPFTSIFLPVIGYRSAKQRQCMDRCNQFCKLPSRILSGETSTTPTTPGPQSQ
ncbi:LIC_10730 family protein [Leptospira kmetyi]|uniref:Lipoprotein n=1 Tax=Leptospira kmetyi TaxID=408139 RepID=A0A2M9XJZ9_9LEPT|nr:hypothetical protein [Leptospira kmetyi]AYV55411.1 hypothetical protein EFP84_07735 [Leptospira kmetyi]EQA54614.1 hypothetical protein LEP1GSC052_2904 [Leptospira kmetyi serovar Malaysia str. Bejo-Iso9]PJZ28826.1 hypothetical protein CH378_15955 [Leptospira kmetyi]PJZ39603.1 hypothetical protein CH370_20660 [Leptospira kmetyi]TGK16791.1 hypothetical protein EHO62_13845 [Leptospira kmetyi]